MEQRIRMFIKEAMIEKNKSKQLTYKNILAGAQKIAKDTKESKITGDMIVKAAKNEIKQLNDLLSYCENDAIRKEDILAKIEYCKVFIPKTISNEEIMEYLTSNNIDKNIGICMKALKTKFSNNLDGKAAQAVVKDYIK